MPKQFLISAEVLEAAGRYLLTRPMGEVEALVNALRQSEPYEPPVEPETDPAKARQA